MRPMTEQEVRRSFVNCSRGGAQGLTLPKDFAQLCQTGDAVSSFTARRSGAAGRNGNTVGTYVCADPRCSDRVRTEIPPWLQQRDPAEFIEERAAELRERAEGFLASVRR